MLPERIEHEAAPARDPEALRARAARLNARADGQDAAEVLRMALRDPAAGELALVSSFGAESVVLLHLAALTDPAIPVLFIDTRLLFPETLRYQQEVAAHLGLRDVRVLRTDEARLARDDPDGRLHASDTDACCALRKTEPLERALAGFDGWITGRKRYQSPGRADLPFFEAEAAQGRIKVNPLARWRPEDVRAHMAQHELPRHPLVARGYPSIGCRPCTTPVAPGEAARAGRWRGEDKDECGIHVVDGRVVRAGETP